MEKLRWTDQNQIHKNSPIRCHERRWERRSSIGYSPRSMSGGDNTSREDLTDLLENLGICVLEEKLRLMVGKVDADGDAQLDAEEFGALYVVVVMAEATRGW
ncbi:Calmodulin-like protein 3 [Striga hermonthica]|uniref:Calmodulin-like protein 3 n=1 Tax=Striga hermonthica TaxID=68872 RepID=A0A9N7R6Q7_STRHE|nr:Calmodulin-like protein 3 [Striga hermonthica]